MTQVTSTAEPAIVEWTKGVEQSSGLDAVVAKVQPLADVLLADPRRAAALRGMWLGHAVHPLLTDLPLGAWTSAMVLDVVGGRGSRPAAQRLTGLGLLAAVPTAVTGWAEWAAVTGEREKRVGVVHAAANNAALLLYFASWRARRRDRHLTGVLLALLGSVGVGVGGYLGGHLTEARKVASRHPAYDD
jgi:uncharacterized membrane protein